MLGALSALGRSQWRNHFSDIIYDDRVPDNYGQLYTMNPEQ
jgi:hypothetical protein